ncbi:hypothetical protein [Pontibacter sp. G13]|uniref:hypothetical protein n=1 Tax=Pontibacter sp. G13 TaxID=3074898 RepID=UPI00288B5F92|nr:hypothetical protein [Pontibacter sp. G13]WNJ19739.1 hypothetical protein RJD25_04585 [Pontibacter sp. G13]
MSNVFTFSLEGWEETETGLLVAESEQWVLIQSMPMDYLIDGYKLIKKSEIYSQDQGAEEERIAKVLSLRGIEPKMPEGFEFGNAQSMLTWIEAKYDLFQFQDLEEDTLQIGRMYDVVDGEMLTIDYIDADGQIESPYDYEFVLRQIRVITFGTDYLDGVNLLRQNQD